MQHILSLARRCVEDYNMIEAGDRIAVGVSGGKDSMMALAALAQLKKFKEIVAAIPTKVREKKQERDL